MATFPFSVQQSFESITDIADSSIERNAWDICKLGNFVLPGISTLTISRARKMVVKNPKQSSYATIKDSGLELARVDIVNVLCYQEEFNKLQEILTYFDSQLGVKAGKVGSQQLLGFPIVHPEAQMRGVGSVYIEDIVGPLATRPGYITTTFKCIEVREIKKSGTKGVEAGPDLGGANAFNKNNPTTPKPSADGKTGKPKKK